MTARRLRSNPTRPRAARAPARPREDVLASFTDAVVVTDHATRIVLFNQAAEELTGLPQARVIGRPCAQAFARMPVLGEMVCRVQRSGQNESRGDEQLHREGRSIPVRIVCLPIWSARDRIRGTAIVIHDLSYQRTLEESARRNESLARLGTMVAGLAHEIRNPLAGVKGAAQLLDSRVADQAELRAYTTVIMREVDRLSGLVEDLLCLGAPPKPRLARLNIHRVVQHALSVMSGELTDRDVHLRCEFDPSLPDIHGDESQLNQVFLNLLKNAVEAMAAAPRPRVSPPTVTVSTRMETDFHILRGRDRASKFLRVEIADQGPGIDPAAAGRVFEPFFTTKPRGTGLGLAISQRIVAEHGGIIRVAPNRPVGTVASVLLPISPP